MLEYKAYQKKLKLCIASFSQIDLIMNHEFSI